MGESVFDIIGPVMIGPSSSHTAGAVNIGRVAGQVFGEKVRRIEVVLYNSFAATYKGHGTDKALVGGVLGYQLSSIEIKKALKAAEERGIAVCFKTRQDSAYHPNTAKVILSGENGRSEVVGASLGGGKIEIREIDGFDLKISGNYNTLICSYYEQVGMVAKVSEILASQQINIAFMSVSRSGKRAKALMVVEIDQDPEEEFLDCVSSIPEMLSIKYIERINA